MELDEIREMLQEFSNWRSFSSLTDNEVKYLLELIKDDIARRENPYG